MILLDHPIWPYIRRYFHQGSDERDNLDVLQPPDQIRELALNVLVNCAACGQVVNCFRVRQKSDRARVAGAPDERRLFYSGTCSSEANPGCSRTTAAKQHKQLIRKALAQ